MTDEKFQAEVLRRLTTIDSDVKSVKSDVNALAGRIDSLDRRVAALDGSES